VAGSREEQLMLQIDHGNEYIYILHEEKSEALKVESSGT
jgi:hypothetical protein